MPLKFDSGLAWDTPGLKWDAESPAPKPKKTKHRMANNPTPSRMEELVAAGEDLCDGLNQHGVAINIKQNTFAVVRADLDALIAAINAASAAKGAQPDAYTALRTADSNAKGYIARAIKVLSIALGNEWSDAWEATGLPNQSVGVPRTQDERFAALGTLKAYFLANPAKEVAALDVTAAIAGTLYAAVSDARLGVGNALSLTKDKLMTQEEKREGFERRYRAAIDEIGLLLDAEDPKWYDFGLNRPADPAQPGQPSNVQASAGAPGSVLVVIDGARRANSFNYYKQVGGTDTEPVKVTNTEGTQYTITGLPGGAMVKITVNGVNGAGEGPASNPVEVVVG